MFQVDYIVAKQAPIKGEVFPTGTGKVCFSNTRNFSRT